ncbi:MAG: hypothetical protein QM598_02785 [Protaetiibacter sp.]
MAEPTEPQSPVEPDATAEPVVVEPVSASEHLGVEPDVPEVDEAEVVDDVAVPVVVEPEPVAAVEPVTAEPVVPVVAESPREVVYVQAPTPPKPRQNRGFGVLISLLGALAFALLYLGAAAVIFSLTPNTVVESTFSSFLASPFFWGPVIVYAVFAVVFALIVNRAAWWAHVIGSLFVAVLSYAVSIGVLALLVNIVGMTPDEAVRWLTAVATSPLLLAVALIARETSLWFGLAIAARGRRVKERNATDRALFEQSVAERRAEYERAHPSA